MTFTEAALEVLRSAGEPLHYKKITEIAIEKNLLSHVGKTPEVTMSSRLATMAKKDRGTAPIVKVKPGVFALREGVELPEDITKVDLEVEEKVEPSAEEKEAPKLPGADVFPEEEGDDDPILAGLEEGDGDGEDKTRRRRRRRRRGGRGGEGEEEEEAPAQAREGARRTGRGSNDRGNDRNNDRPSRDRSRERGRERGGRTRREEPALDWTREPGDNDLLGQDLADAAATVMAAGQATELTFAQIAQLLIQRERLSGDAEQLAPTIAAALRADVANARDGGRARFRISAGHVVLTDWLLGKESLRADEAVLKAADRQRDQMRRALVGSIRSLPVAGFAELIATWLNREGVTALRGVRRPGSSSTELHMAGTLKRGPEEVRVAIVVYRAGADITREAVIEVRGALHHYGSASVAWLVSTGRVTSGAREEVAAEGAVPCALFGGQEMATAMERGGIGLITRTVQVSELDFGLLEALGGDIQVRGGARGGRDSDGDKDGDKDREDGRKRRRGRGRGGDKASSAEGAAAATEGTAKTDEAAAEGAEAAAAAPEADTAAGTEATEPAPEAADAPQEAAADDSDSAAVDTAAADDSAAAAGSGDTDDAKDAKDAKDTDEAQDDAGAAEAADDAAEEDAAKDD